MAALFEAYITNLGKYNEGELVGETLKFPTTTEEVQGLLKRIGVDGVRYEEFFITSFDGDVLGLYDYLTEYENLDELNHLACLLSDLDQSDLEKFLSLIHIWMDEDDNIKPAEMHPGYKECLAKIVEWTEKGYLPPEALLSNDDQRRDWLVNNQIGTTAGWYTADICLLYTSKAGSITNGIFRPA